MNTAAQAKPAHRILNKRMPTLVGLLVLVIGLVLGTYFLGQGTGVFSPRATPQTTPNKVRLTNVSHDSFTVSFITDDEIQGFIKYGDTNKNIKSQASDDRDQLTGVIKSYKTHHITVRGLQPNKTYYYVLGTGSGSSFDNNGQPFTVKTAQRTGTPPPAQTIYGSVTSSSGAPADGSIVYVSVEGAGDMSAQVKNSGQWAIPLSNARKTDGSDYAQINESMRLSLMVQGNSPEDVAQSSIAVNEAQPVPTIALGQGGQGTQSGTQTAAQDTTNQGTTPGTGDGMQGQNPAESTPPSAENAATIDPNTVSNRPSARTGALTDVISDSISARDSAEPALEIVSVTDGVSEEINSTQPQIVGTVAPNVEVTLTINSDNEIIQKVTTDVSGRFSLDLASLGLSLEPGPHTVTYAYTDPSTNEAVSKSETFTILEGATVLTQANPSPTPYGSANPYPIDDATRSAQPVDTTPTPSPSPSPSASASPTLSPSPSATASASPSPVSTSSASTSGRVANPSTASGMPVSGSVGTTMALIIGGIFFIVSGLWSFWISTQLVSAKEQE